MNLPPFPRTATVRVWWTVIRDVATWGLGALWGHALMTAPGPADPTKAVLVAALLGLPFVFRADELRQRTGSGEPVSPNGTADGARDSVTP